MFLEQLYGKKPKHKAYRTKIATTHIIHNRHDLSGSHTHAQFYFGKGDGQDGDGNSGWVKKELKIKTGARGNGQWRDANMLSPHFKSILIKIMLSFLLYLFFSSLRLFRLRTKNTAAALAPKHTHTLADSRSQQHKNCATSLNHASAACYLKLFVARWKRH